jgi:hypothetical protein
MTGRATSTVGPGMAAGSVRPGEATKAGGGTSGAAGAPTGCPVILAGSPWPSVWETVAGSVSTAALPGSTGRADGSRAEEAR